MRIIALSVLLLTSCQRQSQEQLLPEISRPTIIDPGAAKSFELRYGEILSYINEDGDQVVRRK